jgi:hypothetical protein
LIDCYSQLRAVCGLGGLEQEIEVAEIAVTQAMVRAGPVV